MKVNDNITRTLLFDDKHQGYAKIKAHIQQRELEMQKDNPFIRLEVKETDRKDYYVIEGWEVSHQEGIN